MGQVIPMITDRAREQWLSSYPAKFYACRASHDFPRLVPGEVKYTRTWIEFDPDTGHRTIHQTCKNCRRERWRLLVRTGRGWALGGKGWKYKEPKGYAQPPGYGIPRGDFQNIYWDSIVDGYDNSQERIEAATMEANGHA